MDDIGYDVAIVGGGIAGFEAALTLKTLRRKFLWVGTKQFGDKILLAEHVSNFPSFSGTGRELCALLEKQAQAEDLPFLKARIDGIYQSGEEYLLTVGEKTFRARTAILATGVETSGAVKGEREFLGRGVSYCAVCDGALYKGKTVAAVLSSADFKEEAEYLAGFAKKVYVFCKKGDLHFSKENIEYLDDTPLEVLGTRRVEGLKTARGAIEADGVFFLKESVPPSSLVGGLETDKDGHVLVQRDMATNLKGLFAAGDVTGRPYQYAKAAGEGLVAAFSANAFLSLQDRENQENL